MKPVKSQAGVALLIVLMVVALVAIIATEMGGRLQINVQRAINIKENNQAYWYAMAAEQYASRALKTLIEEADDTIHLNQPWSQEFTYPVDGGQITAQLEDMQSCFNLNALPGDSSTTSGTTNSSETMEAFKNLLLTAELEIDSYTADTIRDSLADYIDEDTQMRSYGAEDSEYEALAAPYLAANRLLTVQSELRLIKGVEPTWLAKLLPYVCVIPDNTTLAINVNTLDEDDGPLLAGIVGISVGEASAVIASRPEDGWDDIADFLANSTIQGANLTDTEQDWFVVTTEHFILHTKASYNSATFAMTSVFKASSDDGISLLRREFGVIK